ncbi:hypothetical protein XELAEV_18029450mg [Xenopus laevis]|uniref:Uncharacterized protein n=1 Tax=Xenopus laevis TaxID=8355 RepID=A0A974CTW4_XENLA|nr:hypothetical protein XELAEV_18029450mg [Xenopus laevis]
MSVNLPNNLLLQYYSSHTGYTPCPPSRGGDKNSGSRKLGSTGLNIEHQMLCLLLQSCWAGSGRILPRTGVKMSSAVIIILGAAVL